MVKIRLRRMGKKKQPSYRVVVTDSRSPRDGRFVETIGFYNPRTEPPTVEIKEDRALYWLSQGAQPTDAVARLLRNKGTLDRFARLKEGEDLESLLAEAAAEEVVVEEVAPVEEEALVEEVAPTEAEVTEEEVPSEEELIEAPLEEEIEETAGEQAN
ncbi:MAG: 30S ribosomal protein S16 [Anaerolineae bacterium]